MRRHAWVDRFFGFHRRRPNRPTGYVASVGRAGRDLRLEALESRALLTTFYVDNNLLLTADRDASGGLSPGDQVTFGNGQSYQQADLTYDAVPANGDVGTAFSSIGQALASPLLQPSDTIDIAGGTYSESITIDKSLTLQGMGKVVIEAPTSGSGTGISVDNDPEHVRLVDLDVEGFRAALLSSGAGTLDLIDVTLGAGGPSTFADPFNWLTDVTNLNVVDTSSQSQTVNFDPGPPMGLTPYIETSSLAITLDNITNLSVTTGSGSDTFNAAPIAKTITIDGGNPAPPAQPGDTLNMWFPSWTGNSLSVAKDSGGYSGTYGFSSGAAVHFSHIETISPGVIVQGYQSFNATEGVDTGNILLAQFTDPFGNLPLSDYSADINWTDGTTSSGTISYDAASGSYSVSGDHVFGEAEGGGVPGVPGAVAAELSIVIHRAGSPDTTTYATATISDAPIVGNGTTIYGAEGVAVGPTAAGAVVATFSSGGDDQETPSAFWTRIDWGDGTSTPGTVTQVDASGDQFSLSGSHVYMAAGTYTITATIADGAEETTITPKAVISAPTAIPQTLTGTVGVALGNGNGTLVASFEQDSINNENYQATIDWGDGSTTSGTVNEVLDVLPPLVHRAFWQVYGSHTYESHGNYVVHVALTQNGNVVSAVNSSAAISSAPLTANQQFVSHVYDDLFHRTVDTNGLSYWSGKLDAGLPRAQFVLDIESSDEYRQDEVSSLFQLYLHRSADPSALDMGSSLLGNGASDEQLATIIVGSDEYFALHGGTNDGFLSALFQDALHRPVDGGAKEAFEQDLAAGFSRARMAAIVMGSHEYHAALVQSIYLELLDRDADASGDAYWDGQLDHGATDEQVIAAIAASDEYFSKTA